MPLEDRHLVLLMSGPDFPSREQLMAVLDLPPVSEAEELEAAAAHLASVIARVDVDRITATRCISLIPLLAQVTNVAGLCSLQLARRVDASRMAVPGGGGAADLLARAAGTSAGLVRRRMHDLELVGDHEATAASMTTGHISERQAAEIARTEHAVPGSEEKLLALAETGSATAVEDEGRRIRAAAMDPERLRREQRRLTKLFSRLQEAGMVHLGVTLPPEIGIPLLNELDDRTDRLVRAARAAGGPVLPREHFRALALVGLIHGPGWAPRVEVVVVSGPEEELGTEGSDPGEAWVRETVRRPRPRATATTTAAAEEAGVPVDDPDGDLDDIECAPAVAPRPPAHVGCPQSSGSGDPHLTVVVSAGALQRGSLADGELCHVIGAGPTAPSLARTLLEGGAFLVGVVHDGGTSTHVARFGRRGRVAIDPGFAELVRQSGVELDTIDLGGRQSKAELRTALLIGHAPTFLGAVCSTGSCERRFGLQLDHRNPVANGGRTRWDNVDPECWPDHEAKTRADRRDGLFGGVTPIHDRNLPRRR